MEKHFYYGLGILLVFLILGLFVAFFMNDLCIPISAQLQEATREALSGDFQQGISLAISAKNRWATTWKRIATVADHTPMDEIEGVFAELEVYARSEDREHFSACCAHLAQLLEAMAEAHSLTWWNLL